MTDRLRLVVFDVDGTLVDSQNDIVASMTRAFANAQLKPPSRRDILQTVGLSLPHGMARLVPNMSLSERATLVNAYKEAYAARRIARGSQESSPLFDGIEQLLNALTAMDPLLLGVATGKSQRGLDALLQAHDLRQVFVTTQCADDHPSKPHPAMLHACLRETGINASDALIVGDTSYDIEMGKAASMGTIAVTWGYHRRDQLAEADVMVDSPDALMAEITNWMEHTA